MLSVLVQRKIVYKEMLVFDWQDCQVECKANWLKTRVCCKILPRKIHRPGFFDDYDEKD